MSIDPSTAEFLNGPKFVAWLEERDRLPEYFRDSHSANNDLDNLRRRMTHWREGAQVTLEAADRWCTHLGLCLTEIPDDFWEERRTKKRGKTTTPEFRAQVIAEIRGGQTAAATARKYGLCDKTVWTWMKRHRDQGAAA